MIDAAALLGATSKDGVMAMVWPLSALADPVWRAFVVGRMTGRWPAPARPEPPAYSGADPAKLADLCAETAAPLPLSTTLPSPAALKIVLPGSTLMCGVEAKDDPFAQRPGDEAAGLQAFVWAASADAPALMATLWPAWLARHAAPDRSVAWEAPIVAARAVAVLDFARRHGLPGPRHQTMAALAQHVRVLADAVTGEDPPPSIAGKALMGRALARLGLDLGVAAVADLGLAVLLDEGARLGLPSGMSRLESTHHHLELAGAYADAWLAARRGQRAEAQTLEAVTRRFLGAVHALTLKGGLPPVGDVLPLVAPGWFAGLLRGGDVAKGWTGQLTPAERGALADLVNSVIPADLEALCQDGWLRQDIGPWSGLWHAAPLGWARWNGMGHRDVGAFVLHYDGVPVFVDAGGSAFGAMNGADMCHQADHHGGLQLSGRAPYPPDNGDYTDDFRRGIGGDAPSLLAEYDGVSLAMKGFNRLGGPRETKRRWRFTGNRLEIDDAINGTGRYAVTRRLLTPMAVTRTETGLVLDGQGRRFSIVTDAPVTVRGGECWPGFGYSQPVSVIECGGRRNLPWRGSLVIEAL